MSLVCPVCRLLVTPKIPGRLDCGREDCPAIGATVMPPLSLGQIVYEARFEPEDFARGHVHKWADLPDDAKSKWQRAGDAVAGTVRAEIILLGGKIMAEFAPLDGDP